MKKDILVEGNTKRQLVRLRLIACNHIKIDTKNKIAKTRNANPKTNNNMTNSSNTNHSYNNKHNLYNNPT